MRTIGVLDSEREWRQRCMDPAGRATLAHRSATDTMPCVATSATPVGCRPVVQCERFTCTEDGGQPPATLNRRCAGRPSMRSNKRIPDQIAAAKADPDPDPTLAPAPAPAAPAPGRNFGPASIKHPPGDGRAGETEGPRAYCFPPWGCYVSLTSPDTPTPHPDPR